MILQERAAIKTGFLPRIPHFSAQAGRKVKIVPIGKQM
jgi:hypothetical protein